MRVAHIPFGPKGRAVMRLPEAPALGDCPLHPTAANHHRRLVSIPSDTDSHLSPCPLGDCGLTLLLPSYSPQQRASPLALWTLQPSYFFSTF
eukprot:6206420-Pleurochrysis_carterae.AAC.2